MTLSVENLVSEATLHKFKIYESLLAEWNQGTSLIQHETLNNFYNRHILDSLQIIPLLDPATATLADLDIAATFSLSKGRLDDLSPEVQNISIIDVGTGAGFPGLVLAMCGFANITLCESNFKKCIFLEEVARQTGVVVSIVNKRVEDLTDKFDVVLSRALTELKNLCPIMKQLSRNSNAFGLFHKGKNWNNEVLDAQESWTFNIRPYKSLTSEASVILFLNNLKNTSH